MSLTIDAVVAAVRSFVAARKAVDPGEIGAATPLLSGGYVDSFELVELIEHVRAQLGTQVSPDDLLPEDFETPTVLLERLRALAPLSYEPKRLLDLALTLPLAPAAAILTLGLAAAVKLTSPGPAFFVQSRVGRGGKPLAVYKLRTMVDGAERRGPAVTASGDPRITPLGRILRRTKLDELPQLLNVVRGDMSLVGPRPEAPRYVAQYRPEWAPLLEVRPGITDRASLAFRQEEALLAAAVDRERAYVEVVLPAKAELALAGVAESSAWHDLWLIARTVLTVAGVGRKEDPVVGRCRAAITALNAGGGGGAGR